MCTGRVARKVLKFNCNRMKIKATFLDFLGIFLHRKTIKSSLIVFFLKKKECIITFLLIPNPNKKNIFFLFLQAKKHKNKNIQLLGIYFCCNKLNLFCHKSFSVTVCHKYFFSLKQVLFTCHKLITI